MTSDIKRLFHTLEIPISSGSSVLRRKLADADRVAQLCMLSDSYAIREIGKHFSLEHFAGYEGDHFKAIALAELVCDFVDGVYLTGDTLDSLRVVLKQ